MNENPEVCGACRGACCRRYPGCAFPEDFPTQEVLRAALGSGRWVVDWFEGDPRPGLRVLTQAFFVRPAMKGNEGEQYHAPWEGGECTFLGDSGCELSAEKRPLQCKEMVPSASRRCSSGGYGKKSAALAWMARSGELSGTFDAMKAACGEYAGEDE